MNIKVDKNIFFYFSYTMFLISTFYSRVIFLEGKMQYIKMLALYILFISFLLQSTKYKIKSLILIILCIFLGIVSYVITKSETILLIFLLVLAAKDIDFEQLIKADVLIKTILSIFLVLFHFFNLTNEYIIYRDNALRYSFGFAQPNVFGTILVMIYLEFLYLKRDDLKFSYLIYAALLLFFINNYLDSRTSVMILILSLSLMYLSKSAIFHRILQKIVIKKIVINSFIILTLFSLLLIYLYTSKTQLGITVNALMTGRLSQAANFIEKYGYSILGQHIYFINTENAHLMGVKSQILDNAYVHILIRYGILVYFAFMLLFRNIYIKLFEKKDYTLITILFSIMILGMSEKYLITFEYNMFLFYISNLIFKGEGDNGKKELCI